MDGARGAVGGRAADTVVMRFRRPRAFLATAVMACAGDILFVIWTVVAFAAGSAVQAVIFLPGILLFSFLSVMFFRGGVLHSVLTQTCVRTPNILRGWTVVPLVEIAGVGLRYVSVGRGSRWHLLVWRGEGKPTSITVSYPGHSAPRGQRRGFGPRGHYTPVDWDYLAAMPAGRAALAIYRQVIALQGQDGLLLTRQRQVTAMPEGRYAMVNKPYIAYWSPDGRCGPWPPDGDR